MQTLYITVLEDNSNDLDRLRSVLSEYRTVRRIQIEITHFPSGEEFFREAGNYNAKTDLFLIDIQMGKLTGIDIAKRLRNIGFTGSIIFLTAFRDYVFEGYEVHALNYLLKPVKPEALAVCLDEILTEKTQKNYTYTNKGKVVSFPFSDILAFSSRLHYVDILTVNGSYEQLITLNKIEETLPKEFIRTHRSFIVNMKHIRKITGETIELSNKMTVKIAKTYKRDVVNAFADYSMRLDT